MKNLDYKLKLRAWLSDELRCVWNRGACFSADVVDDLPFAFRFMGPKDKEVKQAPGSDQTGHSFSSPVDATPVSDMQRISR